MWYGNTQRITVTEESHIHKLQAIFDQDEPVTTEQLHRAKANRKT